MQEDRPRGPEDAALGTRAQPGGPEPVQGRRDGVLPGADETAGITGCEDQVDWGQGAREGLQMQVPLTSLPQGTVLIVTY